MKKHHVFLRRITRAAALFLFACIIFILTGSVYAEGEEELPDNGIPVVYIDVDESQGTIAEMLASEDHSVYCYGTMSIAVPEGFHYADFPDSLCESVENLSMSIRGRGNSTWVRAEKKPFKIKLDKKTDLFGLGKNKHWVLVANAMDPSLQRDRITAWLGDQLDYEFTPRGVPVDFVLRGEEYGTQYLGSYYFSENVRVDENRLEIEELEEDDVEYPEITGGYLVQNGAQVSENSPDRFYTASGEVWATDTPSFDTGEREEEEGGPLGGDPGEENFTFPELGDAYDNPAQQKYIQNHMQTVEDALLEYNTDYRELIDVDNSAGYWLLQAFCMNRDMYNTGSTYLYKRRDADGVVSKLYWGPLWDFDFGWDDNYTVSGMGLGHTWLYPMFRDRSEGGFVEALHEQWPSFRENIVKLIEDGGIIDQYYEETKDSAYADHLIWTPDEGDYSYKEKTDHLKNWIINRLAWMDEHFGEVDNLVCKVSYMIDGEEVTSFYTKNGTPEYPADHPAEKEGYIFLNWADEDGNPVDGEIRVDRDMVFTAEFISEEDAVYGQDIAFRKNSDVIAYNSHALSYVIEYCVLPLEAHDKTVQWSVDDESFASVDEDGIVHFTGPGEVTVTAALPSGVSRQFFLKITEDDLPIPETVTPDQDVIHMTVGEETYFTLVTEPEIAKINSYQYESEDESVVTVNEFGVLTAAGPGTARIHVVTVTNTGDWANPLVREAYVTVIVTEPEITYTASPSEASWKKGSKDDLVITVSRDPGDETCFAHFSRVLTDGTPLARDTDYTAVSGSTVITLKAETLEKLSAGTHTVKAEFDDGETEIKLIIEENDPVTPGGKDSPDTGDHRNMGWLWIMGVSLLVFSGALVMRKRAQ